MSQLLAWLDNRTGYRAFLHEALYERVPGGSRWRYIWGSTLVFAFVTQAITGMFLWMYYSPSAQTAWESVYYIQHQAIGGAMLRGIHHYMAQVMVVLLALHLFQVVWDGAYKAPREINFWLGLILMKITLGLALTGYLLPWDQKGYWATQVATKIAGIVPVVGPDMQRLVVGGSEYGHQTLTRFFALHAGVLPAALVGFLVLHVALFRKHGLTAKHDPRRSDQFFWPDQILKDGVACLAILLLVCFLSWRLPAELTAPADGADSYGAARPEWYFLFLFQFLKLFHGETGELIGAVVVPGLAMGVLFLMPLLARFKWGHAFNVLFLFFLLAGAGLLTALAIQEDRTNPEYLAAVKQAHSDGERAAELASAGIPPEGALSLVRKDAKIQGPKLFARHCASCHNWLDPEGVGIQQPRLVELPRDPAGKPIEGEKPIPNGAPNLYRFASRAWIAGLLDPKQIAAAHIEKVQIDGKEKQVVEAEYFGNTAHRDGDMVEFVNENLAELDDAGKKKLAQAIAALSAQAALPYQSAEDATAKQDGTITGGLVAIADFTCTDCHKLGDAGDLGSAPDLTGYGSREWLIEFIRDPAHERFYADNNDRMPSFGKGEDPKAHLLSRQELELIVDWLREDWKK